MNFLTFDFDAIMNAWKTRLGEDVGLDDYIGHIQPTTDELQVILEMSVDMFMPDTVMNMPVTLLRFMSLGIRQDIPPQIAYTAALLAGFNQSALELVAHLRASAVNTTVH